MSLLAPPEEKALVGHDLAPALSHYRKTSKQPLPLPLARFRKKEALETLGKSLVKHRIQTLTGQSGADLEAQLGFSIKAGKSMSPDDVRRLAHCLILQACGRLDQNGEAGPEREEKEPEKVSPKRAPRRSLAVKAAVSAAPALAGRTRRSVAPEAMSRTVGRLTASKKKPLKQVQEEEEEKEEDLGLENPTPAMLTQKRKSLMMRAKAAETTAGTASQKGSKRSAQQLSPPDQEEDEYQQPKRAKKTATNKIASRKKTVVKEQQNGFRGANGSRAFLLTSDPLTMSYAALSKVAPGFTGANLSVLHTPADWTPPEVFNAVRALRAVNTAAGLDAYLALVGCGLTNVHMFREALARQTKHVQFVVVQREDANLGQNDDGKLRDTLSFFLLAYFFPGCEKAASVLPERMVRAGCTTCFSAKSVPHLEDTLVESLSEEGDWILDVCCKGRELSLAAMRAGRNALAMEEDAAALQPLKAKAQALSEEYQ